MSTSNQQTKYTLLARALDTGDDQAWAELFDYYRRFIYYVLKELELDPNDVDDLVQQVMIILSRDLKSFDRSKAKFRTWFSRLIKNVAISHFRKKRTLKETPNQVGGEDVMIDIEGDCSDLDVRIEQEWKAYITNEALKRVEGLFRGNAVEVFQLGLDGLSADEIAEKVGVTKASVFVLQGRVKQSLFQEVRALTEELEGQ